MEEKAWRRKRGTSYLSLSLLNNRRSVYPLYWLCCTELSRIAPVYKLGVNRYDGDNSRDNIEDSSLNPA